MLVPMFALLFIGLDFIGLTFHDQISILDLILICLFIFKKRKREILEIVFEFFMALFSRSKIEPDY